MPKPLPFPRKPKLPLKLPHAKYGISTANMPDYVTPFVAYRAWQWREDGITSLNNSPWTPKVAFEATCPRNEEIKQLYTHEITGKLDAFLGEDLHPVPDEGCTCGMYAGINFQHLIDIGYSSHGIHGEVYLWGRLYRHTLGWRAQYAYPKNFVVPPDMVPFSMTEVAKRLQALIDFDVDIFLQVEKSARVGGPTIPLWVKDYGWSQQGIAHLIDMRKKWYENSPKIRSVLAGDRIIITGDAGGIGIVQTVADDDNVFYDLL